MHPRGINPLLVVDGRQRKPHEIMVVAAIPAQLKPEPGQSYHAISCRGCGRVVMGDDDTLARARLGCWVYCPPCGLANHPTVHAGYDRDTGEALTVEDFATRPNLHGSFRGR